MGEVLGWIFGVGFLVLFVAYIYGTIAAGIEEQKQQNAWARALREQKKSKRYVEDAVVRMLSGANEVTGRHLLATDGLLHTYESVDMDWKRVWRDADKRSVGVPPFGVSPYWTPTGPGGRPVPFSTLAFMGKSARLRIARDPNVDATAVSMLAGDQYLTGTADRRNGDPDGDVFAAAAMRL